MQPDSGTPYPPGQQAPPPAPPSDAELPEPPEEGGEDYADDYNRDRVLWKLKADLQENQKEADRLKKLADTLQIDVEALQKSSQEIDSVVDAYRKEYKKIRSDLGTLRCYFDQKYAEVGNAISDKDRAEVERKIEEVDSFIADLAKDVQGLTGLDEVRLKGGPNGSVQSAGIDAANASGGPGGADDMAKVYEALKGFHKQVTEDLKKLDGWKKDIDEAIAKPDLPVAWFLLLDFKALLTDLEKRVNDNDPKRLSDRLDRAWCELVKARQALRDFEATLNDRTFALKTRKSSLEDATKTRRTRILDAIRRT